MNEAEYRNLYALKDVQYALLNWKLRRFICTISIKQMLSSLKN